MLDEELHDDVDDVGASSSRNKRDRAAEINSEDAALHARDDELGFRRKRGRVVQQQGDDGADEPAPARTAPPPAPPPEADDDSEDDDDDDDNDYGGLARDLEDRRKLAKMSELEREVELADRAEKRLQEQQRKELLEGVSGDRDRGKGKGKGAQPKSKRAPRKPKAVVEDEDDDEDGRDDDKPGGDARRSSRQKPATKSSKAEALQKMKEIRQRKDEAATQLAAALEEDEPEAAEEESEDEGVYSDGGIDIAEELRDDADVEEFDEASFDDILQMQVLRSYVEQWIQHPFLDEILVGCLARIAAGSTMNEYGKSGSVYVICPIVGITTGKPYKLQSSPQAAPIPTDKYVIVRNGKRTQTVQIGIISNTAIQKDEYFKFHTDNVDNGEPQISKRQTQEAAKKLLDAREYVPTAEDVSRMVREKREKGQIKTSFAHEKGRLVRQRDELLARGEAEQARIVDEKLEKLITAHKEQQRLVKDMKSLNARARQSNFKGLNDSSVAKAEARADDPFQRKVTRPIQYWATKAVDVKVADPTSPELSKKAAAVDRSKADLDPQAIMRSLRWNLDKSLLHDGKGQPLIARRLLGSRWQMTEAASRASGSNPIMLTLADYNKKIGLM